MLGSTQVFLKDRAQQAFEELNEEHLFPLFEQQIISILHFFYVIPEFISAPRNIFTLISHDATLPRSLYLQQAE